MAKFKRREAAYVSLTAGLLLQEVVEKECGIASNELVLDRNEQGKPSVHGVTDFFFNLSHSGDYVVLAYSNQEIGVDVERNRHKDLRVAKRCYTEQEFQYVIGTVPEEQWNTDVDVEKRFFRIWTMKESFLKFTGQGISIPLNSFEIDIDNMQVIGKDVYFQEKDIEDYHISVCGRDISEILYRVENK